MLPYLLFCRGTAGQQEHDLRTVFNAVRYMTLSGCSWRLIPNDVPPWAAVYQQFRRWLDAGVLESLDAGVLEALDAGVSEALDAGVSEALDGAFQRRWMRAFERRCPSDVQSIVREWAGHKGQPSAICVHSRTVQSTPESGGRAG